MEEVGVGGPAGDEAKGLRIEAEAGAGGAPGRRTSGLLDDGGSPAGRDEGVSAR